jgi:hypothetical protein
LLRPLHAKEERSCVSIANKDSGLAGVVVEDLETGREVFVGIARCKYLDFGPNLDSRVRLGECVPTEVNRDHLAERDGKRPL